MLITGASRRLGLEFVRRYLGDNWQVFAAGRNPVRADKLKALGNGTGGNLAVVQMDVTEPESIHKAATQLDGSAIDLLINCAGIIGASGQRSGNIDYDSWEHIFDVNTMGPMRVLESFADHVCAKRTQARCEHHQRHGLARRQYVRRIDRLRQLQGGLNMATRSPAIDLAPRGISCVVANPGWVKTDMGGPNATLTPQESVGAIRRIIATLGRKDTGKFYHYDGSEYPWGNNCEPSPPISSSRLQNALRSLTCRLLGS